MIHTRCYQCYERLSVVNDESWIEKRKDKDAPQVWDPDWVIANHVRHQCPNTPKREKSARNTTGA